MASYKGYKRLSKGGTEYLDLTDPKVYNQLTPRERNLIDKQTEWYREVVIISKKDYFDMLQTDFEKWGAVKRQEYILSGEAEKHSQKVFFENYATGLRVRGEANLATLLDWLVAHSPSVRWRSTFYQDLPQLDLFYADKRSTTGKTDKDKQTVGDSQATYDDVRKEITERLIDRKVPKYVIDFALQGGYSDVEDMLSAQGKKFQDLTLSELKQIAKNASRG